MQIRWMPSFEEATQTLVALGTSDTPLARQEVALGLDRLPIANRGRAVEVYETGDVFQHGQLDSDLERCLAFETPSGYGRSYAYRL